MYLIRVKDKGEMTFAECLKCMSQWARAVIAEHESGQADAAPSVAPMQLAESGDEDECQSCQ